LLEQQPPLRVPGDGNLACAVCQHQHGIVWARVTVNGDCVKGSIGDSLQQGPYVGRLGTRIGGDHGKGCGQVGMDHPSPFCDPTDGYRSTRSLDADGYVLEMVVGGHDGLGGVDATPSIHGLHRTLKSLRDLINGERYANDSGREYQNAAWRKSKSGLGRFGNGGRRCETAISRAGVGNLRVHDDSAEPSWSLGQQGLVVQHRGRPDAVLREHPCRRTRRLAHQNGDVRGVRLLQSRRR
jgi:hypothetical protein